MKKLTVILFYCLTVLVAVSAQDNEADKILNAAIYQEEVSGDLQEAIRLYEEIVTKYPENRSVVAEALYRNGLSNEKLGNIKARKYYEKVINSYSEQSELVELAQIRLNRILKTKKPAREKLSVINLYEKGSHLENSSLSPDGTKIAGIEFSIGQNVNIYDRLTDKTQMLTKYEWLNADDGYTYYPVWSPDGKEIVYMYHDSNGICEIQASTLQGKKRTLIKNESDDGQIYPKQWSQDGTTILAFKQDSSGSYTIGLVPAKGGSFTAVHTTQWEERFVKADASLSPDGKFIVFADGQEGNLDLFIIDTNGGTPNLLSGHPANELDPLWSPDGKHIAYIKEIKGGSFLYGIEMAEGKAVGQPYLIKEGMQNAELLNWNRQGISYDFFLDLHEIYTLTLDPETGSSVGVPMLLDYTPAGSNICPVWSYDGKSLAFISYDDEPKVVIQAVDGGDTRHYIIPTPNFWAPAVHDLHWLPDNSGLSFNLLNKQEISIMYQLDLKTGKWQNWSLPIEGWTRTDWGPDKSSFIYADVGSEPGFYQFNIETEEVKRIYEPDTSYAWNPIRSLKFSRDHKKLTFLSGNIELTVLDLETGEIQILAKRFWSPTFSPDGNKILAFCLFGEGENIRTGVAILSLDGEILQQYDIAQYFSSGSRIAQSDWSPDGKQLVFITRKVELDTYLIKNVLK